MLLLSRLGGKGRWEDKITLTNSISGRVDDVVRPPHEPEVAFFVPGCPVAGDVVLVAAQMLDASVQLSGRPVDVAVEEAEEARMLTFRVDHDGDIALDVCGCLFAVVVDDHQRDAGNGLAHASVFDFVGLLVGTDEDGFGLPIAVVDLNAVRHLFPSADHRFVQRFPRAGAVLQRHGWILLKVLLSLFQHQLAVRCRWRTQRGDGVLVEDLEQPDRVESSSIVTHEQRCAAVPRAEK